MTSQVELLVKTRSEAMKNLKAALNNVACIINLVNALSLQIALEKSRMTEEETSSGDLPLIANASDGHLVITPMDVFEQISRKFIEYVKSGKCMSDLTGVTGSKQPPSDTPATVIASPEASESRLDAIPTREIKQEMIEHYEEDNDEQTESLSTEADERAETPSQPLLQQVEAGRTRSERKRSLAEGSGEEERPRRVIYVPDDDSDSDEHYLPDKQESKRPKVWIGRLRELRRRSYYIETNDVVSDSQSDSVSDIDSGSDIKN